MQTNGFGSRPAWSPAVTRLPLPVKKPVSLGQGSDFVESPVLAFSLDTWTAVTSAYLGWGLGRKGNNWSTFWYIVAAVSGFKALHDLGNIQKKK